MMPENPSTQPPIYRHYLTGLGYLGVVLTIVCPAALGMIMAEPAYSRPGTVIIALLAIGAQAGLILLFIGREYRPVPQEERQFTAQARQIYSAGPREPDAPTESTRRF